MLSKQADEVDRRIMAETTRLLKLWQAECKRHEAAEKKLRLKVWKVQEACPHRKMVGTECQICLKDVSIERDS